ncbi:MAG: COX15/CtaA family protein [Williamsia sp.]|nr:COX15/CtaA family protein [Williamsia sp.]
MEKILVHRSDRPVAIWLLVGVGMIVVQVLLGGITRLTGSGLSITEWKPILGTLPPLNQHAWELAFEKYKQIGQFKFLNNDFTLNDFKSIYFWEWLHRLWARLLGVAFAIPFVVFIVQKRFRKEMIRPMLVLFLLGGLQGAIGWIMVKSGLNDENLYVDHIRLAIHFIAALGLLVYTVWFAWQLLVPAHQLVVHKTLHTISLVIVCTLVVQLVYGAFMAGLKAGPAAPTWPMINGAWWPQQIHRFAGAQNLTDNPIMVHFIHRGLAYLIFVLVSIWTWKASQAKGSPLFQKTKFLPLTICLIQVLLGIFTVIHSPQRDQLLWYGAAHQFGALLLLLTIVWTLYLIRAVSVKM